MPHREFEFIPQGNSFVPVLRQMLAYIAQEIILPGDAREQLLFKSKTVLTELLTNAIKHSHTNRTLMRIEISSDSLLICKSDTGKPFELLYHPELGTPGGVLTLSCDALHTLQATISDTCTIQFSCAEISFDEVTEHHNLTEHFGFLLITKAARQFFYQYLPQQELNRFSAELTF